MTFREAVAAFRGHTMPHFDIIHRWRRWFLLSGFFVLLSIVGLVVRGLNFSIDFDGGSLLKYPCPNCATGDVNADDVQATLSKFGLTDASVQVVNGDSLTVRTASLTALGARPSTVIRLPNSSDVSVDEIRLVMASFGRAQAQVSVTPSRVRVRSQPLGTARAGIVLTYDNAKDLSVDDIRSKLGKLGRADGLVQILGTNVVISFDSLPEQPAVASPSPTPSQSFGVSPSASPAPSEVPATRDEAIAGLAKQEGLTPEAVTVADLSTISEDDVIAALAEKAGAAATDADVTEISGQEQAKLLTELADQAGTTGSQINRQDVGPTWGAQISSKALKGLIIFLILVTVYIAFRFEWKMAAAAQTALLHDIIITAGVYALVGRIVSPATVIAILTILGYSLYDTVVIFDKVKENTESLAMVTRDTYSGVVNTSLNQVLMRSVNTSLVVLLPIASLLLFGGDTLKDFAFALFIGVASGTYSSIFVASPMLALLKEREPKYRQIQMRAAARASHRPELPTVTPPPLLGVPVELVPAQQAEEQGAARPAASRPKKKRKTTAAQRRRR